MELSEEQLSTTAQRDALLKASEQLLIAVKHLHPCPGTVATMEAAIASVKGGAGECAHDWCFESEEYDGSEADFRCSKCGASKTIQGDSA